jgi:hypothetical protein
VLGADDHRAELQQLEVRAVPADPRLPVEDRAAALELDGERSEGEERRRGDERRAGESEICRAIHDVRITRRVVPPEAVAAALALALAGVVAAATLRPDGWNVTSLPRVGSGTELAAVAHRVDHGFATVPSAGYDGQFYWAIAVDPLARGRAHAAVDKPTYRYGHPLFGWLGWLFSAGRASGAAGALLAVGLLAFAAAAALAAALGGMRAALFTAASPGLLYAAVHDLAEPLSVALVLGALLALRRSRPGIALACCAFLPLTKEQLVVVPIVLALWTRRPWFLATLLPSVLWWVYARVHLGAWFTTGDTALGAPFGGWKRAMLDAGVRAAGGSDEGTLIVVVALLALLALAAFAAARDWQRPSAALYLVLAAIAICLAPNATVILRDALRNTALLVALVPFLRN